MGPEIYLENFIQNCFQMRNKKYITYLITEEELIVIKNLRNLKFGRLLIVKQDGVIIDKEITHKEKIQKKLIYGEK